MKQYLRTGLSYAYAFKPGRTFAQVLGAQLVADGTGITDTNWGVKLSVSGMASLVSFLQGWADGSDLIGDSAVSDKILGKAFVEPAILGKAGNEPDILGKA